MKVLVVHPGHAFSTADVFDGLVWGLRSNGIDVLPYPLLDELDMAQQMRDALTDRYQMFGQAPPQIDVHAYAARGIPGVVMAQGVTHMIAVTGNNLPYTVPLTLRRGGVHCTLLCTESPYQTTRREMHDAAVYDMVLTNERRAVPLFTRNDPAQVHYLPHAYHPQRHTAQGPKHGNADVLFIGTLFAERKALFEDVDWRGIAADIRGIDVTDGAPPSDALLHVTPNTETAARYRGASIVLNHHRTTATLDGAHIAADAAESLGPRAYEIAACGGFQLCDDSRPELADVFGGTVPTYRAGDSADLETQIRHYLALPHVRESLAAQQRAAVAPHHWGNRARQLIELFASPRRGSVYAGVSVPVTTT